MDALAVPNTQWTQSVRRRRMFIVLALAPDLSQIWTNLAVVTPQPPSLEKDSSLQILGITILVIVTILTLLIDLTGIVIAGVAFIVMNKRNSLALTIRMESRLTWVRVVSIGVIGSMMAMIFGVLWLLR
jgi:hypothetical protein